MVRENTTQRLFDKECGDLVDTNINMTVPWYLMAAYAYYVIDDPLLEDTTFDRLAKKMLANWDNIEHMQIKSKTLIFLFNIKKLWKTIQVIHVQ